MTPDPVLNRHVLAYVALATLATLLASFDYALSTHQVPVPPQWTWVIVVIHPVLVLLGALLPRLTTTLPGYPSAPPASVPVAPTVAPSPTVTVAVTPTPVQTGNGVPAEAVTVPMAPVAGPSISGPASVAALAGRSDPKLPGSA